MLKQIVKYCYDKPRFRKFGSQIGNVFLSKPRSLGGVFSVQKGNFISGCFRPLFEHGKVKQVFGVNLALILIVSTIIPQNIAVSAENFEQNITKAPIVFKTEQSVQYPVSVVRITQGYKFYHRGLDLDGITGDEIKPIMAGKIMSSEYSRLGYGNSIIIDHGNGLTSLYAHLSRINVSVGQEITTSTKLGEMGATGRAFGDHLHLEVYQQGENINPLSILP